MFHRKSLLGLAGAAALVAGMFVFLLGREYSANWIRWVFGPLLWFMGCALLISWLATVAYAAGDVRPPAEESSSKAMKKAG